MAQKFTWKVIREHYGDRNYLEGEERVGTKDELGGLEGKLLELVGPVADELTAEKAEPQPLNKAEVAPANKAARQRKSTGK